MTYILKFKKPKLVYFAIPKAANTSIRHYLSQFLDVDRQDTYKNIHQQVAWDGLTKGDFRDLGTDYLSFTVLRNPWERIVSVYSNKICGSNFHKPMASLGFNPNMDFLSYIDLISKIPDKDADIHFTSQWGLLQHQGKLLPQMIFDMSEISKLELLLKSWISHHGINEEGSISLMNKSDLPSSFINCIEKAHLVKRKSGILSLKTQEVLISNKSVFKDKIYNRYKKDINLFGYEFPY